MFRVGAAMWRRDRFGRVSMAALTAALLAGAAATPARAAATWTGATSQDWFTTSNWAPAAIPTSADQANINGNQAAPTIVGKAGAVAGNVSLGVTAGQTGALTVDGGALAVSTQLLIGDFGSGILIVKNGGTLSSNITAIANNTGSTGTVTITGVGSSWSAGSFFDVGSSGNGTLNVLAGGKVTASTVSVGDDVAAAGIFGDSI